MWQYGAGMANSSRQVFVVGRWILPSARRALLIGGGKKNVRAALLEVELLEHLVVSQM
jgi:hypothetical protein